ncbi:MAG TPA: hypothetical protein VL092_12915 [Chitinophagaceae bacterium]|nr:hypothetical protein [Chitinophagaceae bacterium]
MIQHIHSKNPRSGKKDNKQANHSRSIAFKNMLKEASKELLQPRETVIATILAKASLQKEG